MLYPNKPNKQKQTKTGGPFSAQCYPCAMFIPHTISKALKMHSRIYVRWYVHVLIRRDLLICPFAILIQNLKEEFEFYRI